MMNNMLNVLNLYSQLKNNPGEILRKRFNISQEVDVTNPNAILQYLLNTGQISQQQVNTAMNMRNNPMIKQFFNN